MAVAVSLALVIGGLAWLVVKGGGGGDSGPAVYREEPATPAAPFTIATVAGDEFSLSDHLGQDVVLLYFNEGTG